MPQFNIFPSHFDVNSNNLMLHEATLKMYPSEIKKGETPESETVYSNPPPSVVDNLLAKSYCLGFRTIRINGVLYLWGADISLIHYDVYANVVKGKISPADYETKAEWQFNFEKGKLPNDLNLESHVHEGFGNTLREFKIAMKDSKFAALFTGRKIYLQKVLIYDGKKLTEDIDEALNWEVPKPPGTVPIPSGHVRLYHQTSEKNLGSIKHNGLQFSKARGIEGPKAIWADEQGFYGKPIETPTVEFHIPKERWQRPFVIGDVSPQDIIAVHHPWYNKAREWSIEYKDKILSGEHDDLLDDPYYGKPIRFIKHKFSKKKIHEDGGTPGVAMSTPTNNVGSGHIASVGIGAHGEPGIQKKRKFKLLRRKSPLEESIVKGRNGGIIIVNPSRSQIKTAINLRKDFRIMRDKTKDVFVIWDANNGTHTDISSNLNSKFKFNNFDEEYDHTFSFKGRPNDIVEIWSDEYMQSDYDFEKEIESLINNNKFKTLFRGYTLETNWGSGILSSSKFKNKKYVIEAVSFHNTIHDTKKFGPLSHFGTKQAANDRSTFIYKDAQNTTWSSKDEYLPKFQHKVDIDLGKTFVCDDIGDHTTKRLLDHLIKKGMFTSEEGKKISKEMITAFKSGGDEKFLADAIRAKGYNTLKYKNTEEDAGSTSYIITDPKQIKIIKSIKNPKFVKEEDLKEDTFGGNQVFDVDPEYFHKSTFGKQKHHRYSRYVGSEEQGELIRVWGRKNLGKGIILRNNQHGGMVFLKQKGKYPI